MSKPKTKKQLESWVLMSFKGEYVTINDLTESEAKAHLLEHIVAMDKMAGNAQKTLDQWHDLDY